MISKSNKTNRYRWILAMTVTGMFVMLFLGSRGLGERFISFASIDDETHWTLANGIIVTEEDVDWTLAGNEDVLEKMVDWTLANNDSQDTNEKEPDWTLARNDGHDQADTDWNLAS
ncbi:hypothetical protein [Candidatus Nitrospira allomarina]|uniref:Uncharacterized protein n=1 Tax=Candidatus Nitrospira allomarina TaxID=3020900 RepID=A0AA96GAB9_9BACT|nr:hypothetical protein [Candidatus Nitrospira allomarina]WNM58103.1 hypothetical protein PP769_19365 [Candidatus Nitrospira allomarina]